LLSLSSRHSLRVTSYKSASTTTKTYITYCKNSPRIVYTVPEFLNAVLKSKKGQAIIFDEAGVGVPAKEQHQKMNRIMQIITQILRFKNICVIFTIPNIRLLDINLREAITGSSSFGILTMHTRLMYAPSRPSLSTTMGKW